MLWFLAFALLLLVACLLAAWRGGAPERIVAGAYLSAWLASLAVENRTASQYLSAEPAMMAVDGLLLALLLAVALRANRYWPMVAVSMQAIIVLAHLLRLVDPGMMRLVYLMMTWSWPFFQLSILLAGTALHWVRVARNGADPSWSRSSSRLRGVTANPWPGG